MREEGDGVLAGLSAEEADNLVRNNKRQKHVTFPEPLLVDSQANSFVKETPLHEGLPQADSVQRPKDLFPTATRSEHESDSGGDSSAFDSGDEDSEDEDEIDEELLSSWDPGCPIVKISKEEKKSICIPWKRSVIIKVLGKRVGYKMLQNRLYKLWHPSSSMEIIDLENEYFLRVVVWIRIPGLPVEYYDRKILWRIGDTLGHTIKIDNNTLRERVVGLEKEQTKVEVPAVTTEQVVLPTGTNVMAVPEEGFGPWMLVQRGGRRGLNKPEAARPGGTPIKETKNSLSTTDLEVQEGSNDNEKAISDSQDQSNLLVHDKSAPSIPGPAHLRKQRTRASVRIEKKVFKGISLQRLQCPLSTFSKKNHVRDAPPNATGPKFKGCVGIHKKSHVRFKGVKEAARIIASTNRDTWPFVCLKDSGPIRDNLSGALRKGSAVQHFVLGLAGLGRDHASSSKPPDDFLEPTPVVDLVPEIANDLHPGQVGSTAISSLDDDSQMNALKELAVSYFVDLFKVDSVIAVWPLCNSFPTLSADAIHLLGSAFSSTEIREGVYSDPGRIMDVNGTLISLIPKSRVVLKDLVGVDFPISKFGGTVQDVSSREGSWIFDNFSPWLSSDVVAEISTNVAGLEELGWVKWNLDGSVIGPGSLASSGCVLRDSDGRWLHGLARNIGSTSITCAELWAFKDATQASLQRGDQDVAM
ncbi:Ribonuclease H-like superfamily [Sesbania bispinosa]|nr:Ribonuclease H-like superfamily [Sesbania bispinosa]